MWKFFPQRNHTLFGSVWSSMRRKGQAPFGKRNIGKKSANKGSTGVDKRFEMDTMESDGDDFLYNSMRQVVSEGMNHITKTLMRTGGYDDGTQIIGQETGEYNNDCTGDMVNYVGDIQARNQESIPLRPLVINNNNNTTTTSHNQSQHR